MLNYSWRRLQRSARVCEKLRGVSVFMFVLLFVLSVSVCGPLPIPMCLCVPFPTHRHRAISRCTAVSCCVTLRGVWSRASVLCAAASVICFPFNAGALA